MDMLTFTIETDSKLPIYDQLYSFIKSEIQSGKIPHDSKLPSKRKLSAYLKISQNTIQAAYDQLIEEGYVVAIEKKGYFVSRIENIINLNIQNESQTLPKSNQKSTVPFDFSYHGVDMQTFPFSIWRKLTKEVINEYDRELLELGDSQGYQNLRMDIAYYLHQSRGVNCNEQQIIISSGTEILFQTLIQLFDQNSIYGIENPGYEKLNLLFKGNRANYKAIGIDKDGMIPEEVNKSNANILCITPSHQFPSGEIMPIKRRIELLNWANSSDNRYLIEDDYDSEFKYSGKPIPALQGLDQNEKVIYMGSFSKSLSPTIRVSYMVLPKHLMKQYIENFSYIICPVPIIDQKVLSLFIHNGYFERHLNKMRNIYKKKRELLVNEVQKLNSNIEIIGADAGLHLLLRIYNGMNEKELVTRALEQGVRVYGISKYYFEKRNILCSPIILIGYAAISEDEIRKAVQKLKKAWFMNSTPS